MTHRLAAALAALSVLPLLAAGEEAPLPVVVSAMDWQDEPVAAVEFEVISAGAEEGPRITTDEFGQARLEDPTLKFPVTVRLADPAWIAITTELRLGARRPFALFPLFPSDPARMSPPQRWEYARTRTAQSAMDGQPANPLVLSMTRRYRGALGDPLPPPAPEEEEARAVAIRVIDGLGQPGPGVLLALLLADEESNTIRFAATERTDSRGSAMFRGLPPGMVARIESQDDTMGRSVLSDFFVTPAEGTIVLRPLVLRTPNERFVGVVTREGEPQPGVLVRIEDEARAVRLTTDEYGFFRHEPVRGGLVGVRVIARTPSGESAAFELDLDPGEGEFHFPLELLLPEPVED